MALLATKVYRPDTISVANWETDLSQPILKTWWKDGSNLKMEGSSEFEQLMNRKLLRDDKFYVVAHKMRGYLRLEAFKA